jgi:hypothetical protein
MNPMRRLLPLMLGLLLAACARETAPPPAQPAAPTLPTVGEILADPTPGPITTVGYVFTTSEGAALIDGLRLTGAGAPAAIDEEAIWLGPAPTLGAGGALTTAGEVGYAIVEATGRLEGPGRYGPGGRYSYSLADPVLTARSARDLRIALLLTNSSLYEGQPVRLSGQLLVSPDTALLVESMGAGGVPDANALQVKLATPPRDPALAAALKGDGRVSYGPVEIVGLWRGGRLYPLAVSPL